MIRDFKQIKKKLHLPQTLPILCFLLLVILQQRRRKLSDKGGSQIFLSGLVVLSGENGGDVGERDFLSFSGNAVGASLYLPFCIRVESEEVSQF